MTKKTVKTDVTITNVVIDSKQSVDSFFDTLNDPQKPMNVDINLDMAKLGKDLSKSTVEDQICYDFYKVEGQRTYMIIKIKYNPGTKITEILGEETMSDEGFARSALEGKKGVSHMYKLLNERRMRGND